MIIQYTGIKEKLTINSPIGVGNKRCKEKIIFTPKSTHVFSEEEGALLLKLDSINFKEAVHAEEKEKENQTSVLKEPKKRGRPKVIRDDNINHI